MIPESQLRALAELVHQLRPAWNRAGILGAIHAASGRPLDQLLRAAIDAALDPTATTPAVIQHRDGNAWTPAPSRRAPQPPPIHAIDLGRPNPNTAAHAAAARAALRQEQP